MEATREASLETSCDSAAALAASLFRPVDDVPNIGIEGHQEVSSWGESSRKGSSQLWIYRSVASGFEVEISENEEFGIGGKVWVVSVDLCRTLERLLPRGLAQCRVLELGAGCGLVGLVLASTGHSVLLTDTPSMQPHLNANVEANRSALGVSISVEADVLAFGNDVDSATVARSGPYDLIVGADITFLHHIRTSLIHTLLQLCSPATVVVLGHTSRAPDTIEQVIEEFSEFFEVGAPLHKGLVEDPFELQNKTRETVVLALRRKEFLTARPFGDQRSDLPEQEDRACACEVCGSPIGFSKRERCAVCPACLAAF